LVIFFSKIFFVVVFKSKLSFTLVVYGKYCSVGNVAMFSSLSGSERTDIGNL
jgi:hypothetical protein